MAKSIYETIKENISLDGKLPYGFEPYPNNDPGMIGFMPGAQDGIGMYITGENADKAAMEIAELIISDPDMDRIAKIAAENRALSVVDKLIDIIYERRKSVEPRRLAEIAMQLAFESGETEAVKIGIALLGLLDLSQMSETVNKLCTLAAYEELTLYVVNAFRSSDEERFNDILFEIAKKTHGWGKIDAVDRLEPKTAEIRRWLLTDGCSNAVGNEYLGLECARKGDMISALRGKMDEELFDGICLIMSALVSDGPADGMEEYEHAAEAMMLFVKAAPERIRTVFQLVSLFEVRDWLSKNEIENKMELLALYNEAADSPRWSCLVQEILDRPESDEFHIAVETGKKMGLDMTGKVKEAIKAMPYRYYGLLNIPYKDPQLAQDMTEFLEDILPLNDIAAGMGEYLFSPTLKNEHHCLDFALQEIQNYPHMGEKLIAAALGSPVTRERNGACRALEKWSEQLGLPISEMCPELYALIKKIAPTELNSELKMRMNKLL